MIKTVITLILIMGIFCFAFGDELINEGFEEGVPPAGWTVIDNFGWSLGNWDMNYNYVRSGNYSAGVYGADKDDPFYSLPQDELLYTGAIDLSMYTSAEITFWDLSWNTDDDVIKYNTITTLEVSSDVEKATWTPIWTFPDSGMDHCVWYEEIVDLSDYAGQTIWLGWHHYYNGDPQGDHGDSFFVDDVVVTADIGDDDDDNDDDSTDDDETDDDSDDDDNDEFDDTESDDDSSDDDPSCCGNCENSSCCGCC